MKISEFFQKIFLGSDQIKYRYVSPALSNQWKNVLAVWNDSKDKTFGVERLTRLFLAISAYAFPGIYIRHLSGKRGLLSRKIALEVYVLFKTMIPAAILIFSLDKITALQIATIYFLVETLFYLLGLIFLSDIYAAPISNKRSYLMVILNYIEISLGFAVLFHGQDLLSKNIGAINSFDAVYFSFITAATIGYGDITPKNWVGQFAVIVHSLSTLILATLIFTTFSSNINAKNHSFNERDDNKERR